MPIRILTDDDPFRVPTLEMFETFVDGLEERTVVMSPNAYVQDQITKRFARGVNTAARGHEAAGEAAAMMGEIYEEDVAIGAAPHLLGGVIRARCGHYKTIMFGQRWYDGPDPDNPSHCHLEFIVPGAEVIAWMNRPRRFVR